MAEQVLRTGEAARNRRLKRKHSDLETDDGKIDENSKVNGVNSGPKHNLTIHLLKLIVDIAIPKTSLKKRHK